MTDLSEQAPRRGMSFPFFLTVLLFAAILADRYWLDDGSPATGASHPNVFAAVMILGFLLWLWVLAAARRRAMRFEGPIQTARGSNGALQPILATIMIVVVVNLANTYTIPKWLGLVSEVSSQPAPESGEEFFDIFFDKDPAMSAPVEVPDPAVDDEPMPTAEQLLDAIIGDDDEAPRDKTSRSQRSPER